MVCEDTATCYRSYYIMIQCNLIPIKSPNHTISSTIRSYRQ